MKKFFEREKITFLKKSLLNGPKLFFKNEFFRAPIAVWLISLSFLFNLVNWAVLFIFIKPVDLTIILHYNVYFGVDAVDDYRQAYIMPLIGLFLLLINLILAKYFYDQKERIASYIMLMAALMIQLSLLVASASIVIINY